MDFRILGPLEVYDGDRPLGLGGTRQRALLGMLLLHANEVVSSDRLVEELWAGEAGQEGSKALQVAVSRLRKVLEPGRAAGRGGIVVTRPPGYELHLDPHGLDLTRFEALVAEGREALAAGDSRVAAVKLRDGLRLWRGPPLADLAYESFCQGEIARLEELRLSAVEDRIAAELKLGRHGELIAELLELIGSQPLRERPRAQLMLALYRSGREAEALEVYQQARTALVEEVGIEPGRSLRDLHQAILEQDPALDFPAEEPPQPEERAPSAPRPVAAGPIRRDMRKTVTAVSVGVAISTEVGGGLDPEALRRVIGRAFGEVDAAVERHGGTVETVTGDAVTAVFGLPMVHEDDALRSVRAAAEVRDALSGLAAQLAEDRALRLDFRIGISTGAVVAGGDGGGQLRATGKPLTFSSRLGEAAESREIVIDEATHRLVRDAIVAEATNDAWRFLEVTEQVRGQARRLVSSMIGRRRERRRLEDAFEQAVGDRSCQLFTVLGLAGVGKSRLVQESLGDLASQALVARGRCLPYGEGITFWPLLEVVKELIDLEDISSPEDGLAKLTLALAGEQNAELTAQQLAEMIGLVETGGGAEDGFAAVRALFQALARSQPLVLVFDDIHWGEARFLDLVEHIAGSMRNAPILLVCLARPELLEVRPGWGGGKLNATSVLLEPLSEEECGRLIENLVGPEPADEVASRIAGAAEGNPLFVEEMLSMLIDDGLLVREKRRWVATRDLASVPMPPTIQALLAARLDRLGPDERAVIERAAVEGKVFHEGPVASLAPDSLRPAVGMHLETLVRKELIRPEDSDFVGERAFRFRHLLVRDAAYDSIPKAARAELHELFGRWLEQRSGEHTTGYDEIIGYHLEQAYLYRVEVGPSDHATKTLAPEAARRLGSAGRRAFGRGDAAAAINLISRAVALLPADDPSRIDLVPNVRVVQGLSGDLSWADRVLTEAVATAAATHDRRLEAHALVQRAFLRLFTQPGVRAQALFDVAGRGISVFEELGDELGLARAYRLLAQAHYLARRGGPSVEASERALEHGRRAGDRFEQREIVAWFCVALMLGPTTAPDAATRCEELLSDPRHDPILEPTVLAVLADVEAMQGRMRKAGALLARWRLAVAELGESVWLLPIHFGFFALVDDPAAAERDLRAGYEALKGIGETSHFSSYAGHLARTMCALGRYDEAQWLSRESEEAARPNDVHSQLLWRSARAQALAHKGALGAAEALAREAVAFAAESDFLDSHGAALSDLAEVLLLAARRREAAVSLEKALRLYEQKGNLVSAARARGRLEELV
jgi:DNA-binding SARP family transcriptional activator/class 3 adenylate cyclase